MESKDGKQTTHRFTTDEDRADCAEGRHEAIDLQTDGEILGGVLVFTQRCCWCDATRTAHATMVGTRYGKWSK